MPPQTVTYRDSGVDIDAMNLAVQKMRAHVRSTYTAGVLSDVGSFGGIFAVDWKSFVEPVLVSSIDGVGTKLKVAFAMNKHDTIGADLVSHCVNDILVQGAKPLFFLDYFSTGKLSQDILLDVVKGISDGCRAAGCALLGGETAEMPGMYQDGEYDLAGTIVGVVDRAQIIDGSTIKPGDVLVGLESDGLHTNGYSLARRVLFDVAGYAVNHRPSELGGVSVGEALLAPHRCYAKPVLELRETIHLKGIAHLTGGGFIDNIPRILPEGCGVQIDRSAWTVPKLFELIGSKGNVPLEDMFRTFNMGIGLILVIPADAAQQAVDQLTKNGEHAHIVGVVTAGETVVQL